MYLLTLVYLLKYDIMQRIIPYIQDFTGCMRAITITGIASMLDFFAPIEHFIIVIPVIATIDMFWGLAADNLHFRKSKFFRAIVYLLIYLLILLVSFWVGIMMEQDKNSTKSFVSWITWVVVYCYALNILKNIRSVYPENKVIAFLYWVGAVKFLSKVNYLEEYMKSVKNKEEKE